VEEKITNTLLYFFLQEENEVPDDETINQMIARSEEEFETYQKMDLERRRKDSRDPNRRPRLMEENELPAWMVKDDTEVERLTCQEEDDKLFGRGSRQRKEVDYSDSITEKEFLEAIEDDTIEEAEESPRQKKQRKRRKREPEVKEIPKAKKKRGRPPVDKASPNPPRLMKQLTKLMELVTRYRDSDGRVLASAFKQLPAKKELPHYYEVIKKPVDLRKIKQRIKDHKYRSLDEFEHDFMLMCKNAQTYNAEESLIYDDSIVLQSVFTNARDRLEKDGDLGMDDEDSEEDDKDDEMGRDDDEEVGDSDEDLQSVRVKIKLGRGSTPASTSRSKPQASSSRSSRKGRGMKKYIVDDSEEEDE